MGTSGIDVGGMLSALSAHGVGNQLAKSRGVERVEVNYVSGSATVVYDESITDLQTIKPRGMSAVTTAPAKCCRSMCACPRIRRTTGEESRDRAEER